MPNAPATVVEPLPGGGCARAIRTDAISGLAKIFEPETNIALFERTLPSDVERCANLPVFQNGFGLTLVAGADEAGFRILHSKFDPLDACALATDIFTWMELLHEVTGCDLLGIRLTRIEWAMCPSFHTDRVTLRLVTAYAGQGTEVIASRNALPPREVRCRVTRGDATEFGDSDNIWQASTGDIVLLKGEAWPGNENRGALHRSPPAAGSRLLLTLDAL